MQNSSPFGWGRGASPIARQDGVHGRIPPLEQLSVSVTHGQGGSREPAALALAGSTGQRRIAMKPDSTVLAHGELIGGRFATKIGQWGAFCTRCAQSVDVGN